MNTKEMADRPDGRKRKASQDPKMKTMSKIDKNLEEKLMQDNEVLEDLKAWASPNYENITEKPKEGQGERVESAIVDRTHKEASDDMEDEVEIIINEPIPKIDDEVVFTKKVKSIKKDNKDWADMKKRDQKTYGRDYLLTTLPILPSIPGKQVGRGQKAAKASKLRAMKNKAKPQLAPIPRESHEQLLESEGSSLNTYQIPTSTPSRTKERANDQLNQTTQTSPCKPGTSKETRIEEAIEARDNEIIQMSTILRGRDARMAEARLKNDHKTIMELQNKKERDLGKMAARTAKAERVRHTLVG